MNIKALITSFAILGSASAAMASPSYTVSAHVGASVQLAPSRPTRIVDARNLRHDNIRTVHRTPDAASDCGEVTLTPSNNLLVEDASVYKGSFPVLEKSGRLHNRYKRSWVAITEATRIDRGRQFISDLPNLGWFTKIRLANLEGKSSVSQVYIQFDNGEEQIVQLNRTLSRWSPNIDIDLKGNARQLKRVIVYGASGQGASYQLMGL